MADAPKILGMEMRARCGIPGNRRRTHWELRFGALVVKIEPFCIAERFTDSDGVPERRGARRAEGAREGCGGVVVDVGAEEIMREVTVYGIREIGKDSLRRCDN